MKARTKVNAKATTTATATAAGNQRPAAKNRQPPTCFSPVADRLSLLAAGRRIENNDVVCSVTHAIFVITSMFLSVASALAGRAQLKDMGSPQRASRKAWSSREWNP